ncbi:MAG: toxin-activating lysine-acyltransferase [Proteobacteria bacterium]|nr:toxin-activating lysine-acyltransferase [Pseudomonadota bacterium]
MRLFSKSKLGDDHSSAPAENGPGQATTASQEHSSTAAKITAPDPQVDARSIHYGTASPIDGGAASPSGHQTPNAPADAASRAAATKRLYTAAGEIVSVLMRSPETRALTLGQLEALIGPALNTGQFLVAEAQSKADGSVAPMATVLWATVSAEVDQRLSAQPDQPFQLAPNEWRSGEVPWLVLLAGDQRLIGPMLKALQDNALRGCPLKMRTKDKNGNAIVGTLAIVAAPAPSAGATTVNDASLT